MVNQADRKGEPRYVMIFYKRFIGDYQRDTAHLSLAAHGAYTLLLDLYYGTEKPLPNDRKVLYRMLRADGCMERRAIDAVIDEFWFSEPDGYRNRRADRMIAEAAERSGKAKKSADTRWKNHQNPKKNAESAERSGKAKKSADNRQNTDANALKKDANALKKDANALKKDANGYASQSHSQTPERDSAAVRLKDGAAAESLLPKERMRANEELKTTSAIKGSLAEWTKFRNDLGEDGRPGVRAKAERKIAKLQRLLLEG